MERELVARVEGRGVDDDPGIILIYRLGEQVSLVATFRERRRRRGYPRQNGRCSAQ